MSSSNAAAIVSTAIALALWLLRQRDRSARAELDARTNHDVLTGLPNRSTLAASVARAARTTRDGTHSCAVLFCDLDRFKQVNDTYGHELGDRLMVEVADRLRSEIAGDRQLRVVRYGGDEFVVVAGDLRGPIDAERLAGRLLRSLHAPFELGPDTVRISAAIGVAVSSTSGTDVHDLLRDADIAMYRAKATGAGSICVFDRAMRARLTRAEVAAQLRAAVEADQVDVRFAPVLSVRDGALVAVRAVLHWTDEDGVDRTGPALLDALDEIGLIVRVGMRMVERSCALARRWRELAPEARAVQVHVGVPSRLLNQASFRDQLARALHDTGGRTDQLCLLVDEDTIASDVSDTWAMLRHVRALGVHIALDGFGARRSSLTDLRHARLDQLCIDGSLIGSLDHDGEDAAIVEHLIGLAHKLQLTVTASEVTSAAQLARLRRLGCDHAWGSYLGQELAADDVDVLVRAMPRPRAAAPPEAAQPALPRLRPFGGPAAV